VCGLVSLRPNLSSAGSMYFTWLRVAHGQVMCAYVYRHSCVERVWKHADTGAKGKMCVREYTYVYSVYVYVCHRESVCKRDTRVNSITQPFGATEELEGSAPARVLVYLYGSYADVLVVMR